MFVDSAATHPPLSKPKEIVSSWVLTKWVTSHSLRAKVTEKSELLLQHPLWCLSKIEGMLEVLWVHIDTILSQRGIFTGNQNILQCFKGNVLQKLDCGLCNSYCMFPFVMWKYKFPTSAMLIFITPCFQPEFLEDFLKKKTLPWIHGRSSLETFG